MAEVDTEEIQRRAGIAAGWLEHATREDGSEYWRRKDGAPEWVEDLCREAHGDMFPDDWRYEFIYSGLSILADEDDEDSYSERLDSAMDVYTMERLKWLSSHLSRLEYVDDGISEFGWNEEGGIAQAVGVGQYKEREEVLHLLRGWLSEDEWQIECGTCEGSGESIIADDGICATCGGEGTVKTEGPE